MNVTPREGGLRLDWQGWEEEREKYVVVLKEEEKEVLEKT